MNKKLRVAVLMGGPSGEREVSLASGREVVRALAGNPNFEVLPIEVGQDGRWIAQISKSQIDVAFIAMHGRGGEDGTIQGLLELLGIPYTGSGVLASALGMDKVRSLSLFRDAGLKVPKYQVINTKLRGNLGTMLHSMELPVVTKPNYHGSSLGVEICHNQKELRKGFKEAQRYDKDVIVQQFIKGRELTCAVLGNEKPKALPVVEIVPRKGDFYDYASKYEEGGSDHIVPAKIPAKVAKQIQQWAVKSHQIVGCAGFSRVDFIWGHPSPKASGGEHLYVLEINTIPGLTPTSLFPDAAKAGGYEFSELIEKLIHLALERK